MGDGPPENPLRSALLTDLYELTMAQAYDAEGMGGEAVFELYFRTLPGARNFAVAAGLEDVLDYIDSWGFGGSDIDYLRAQGKFTDRFLERLRGTRFTGSVRAVREGSVVFPNEPIVQVRAPIFEAQILETFILNQVHYQTVAASKAARVVLAAGDATVVDFGSRRAHGADAAMKAARCCWLAGGAGTSNVLAGKVYGVPIFGTMAHAYVQAHEDEASAFERFAERFENTTLLVDTYDTMAGIERVIELLRRRPDLSVGAVRLDSGDLGELAKRARARLDGAGLERIKIFASGGLDEWKVAELLGGGAPIDGLGVGTKMVVSDDAPGLDVAYKLVEYDDQARTKLSSSKVIYPGAKQVWRTYDRGVMAGDTLGGEGETYGGEPLLETVIDRGERTEAGRRTLSDAREHAAAQLKALPERLRSLERAGEPYPVRVSDALRARLERLRETLEADHSYN